MAYKIPQIISGVSGVSGNAQSGISGNASSGISGNASSGISGNSSSGISGALGGNGNDGTSGISGNASSGISGNAAQQSGTSGISGNAQSGISGNASSGISGNSSSGISGNSSSGISGNSSSGISGNAQSGISGNSSSGISGLVQYTNLYYQDVTTDVAQYFNLIPFVSAQTQNDDSATATGTSALINNFITSPGSPNEQFIASGNWFFNYWGYASSLTSTTNLIFTFFTRNLAGTETKLFEVTGSNISSSSLTAPFNEALTYTLTSNTYLSVTDRLVSKVYGNTLSTNPIVVHFLNSGTAFNSYVRTPMVRIGGISGISGNAQSGNSGISGNASSGTSGISGNAQSGISGNASSGISGNSSSGTSGISGNAQSGISGNASSGISGNSSSGISGNSSSGISGTQGGNGTDGTSGISGNAQSGISGNAQSGISGNSSSGISGNSSSGTSGISGNASSGISGLVQYTNLYYQDVATDIGSYNNLIPFVSAQSQSDISTTATSTSSLVKSYVTSPGSPDEQFILSGNWKFNYWAYASSLTSTTNLIFQVLTRNLAGTETKLFEVTGSNISSSSLTAAFTETLNYSLTSNTYLNVTDRLVSKVYGNTLSPNPIIVHFVNSGTATTTNVQTPMIRIGGISGISGNAQSGTSGISGNAQSGISGALGGNGNDGTSGISGNAQSGISGNASSGISGNASSGISGNASSGISGNASSGISGNSSSGISGNASSGTSGISGNSSSGISGNASSGISGIAAGATYPVTINQLVGTSAETEIISATIPANTWGDGEWIELDSYHSYALNNVANSIAILWVGSSSATLFNSTLSGTPAGVTADHIYSISLLRYGSNILVRNIEQAEFLGGDSQANYKLSYFAIEDGNITDSVSSSLSFAGNTVLQNQSFTADKNIRITAQFYPNISPVARFNTHASTLYKFGSIQISAQTISGVSGISGNAQSGNSGISGNAQSGTSGISGNAQSGNSGISGNASSGTSGISGNAQSGISGNASSGTSGISGNAQSGTSGISGNASSGISGLVQYTNLYYQDVATDIGSYNNLIPFVSAQSQSDISTTATSTSSLIKSYVTSPGSPNEQFIASGNWKFTYWAYASSLTSTTNLIFEIFTRNLAGTETKLFEATGSNISSSSLTSSFTETLNYSLTSNTYLNVTDRLVSKVYGNTLSPNPIVVHFVNSGTATTTNVQTPMIRIGGISGISGNAQSGTSGISGNAQSGTSGISGNAQSGTSGISGNAQSGTSGISGNSSSGISGNSSSGISGNASSGISGTGGSGISGNGITVFSKGGVIYKSTGISETVNLIAWYATQACTATNVRGYLSGSTTGSTINARKNGVSKHLGTNFALSASETWLNGGSLSSGTTAYAIGDKLEIMITSISGTPLEIAVQVDFSI